MNFAGHVRVAQLTEPAAETAARFFLGAILPDVAAMGRFRLERSPDDTAVGRGVDFHHRTDDAFHRHRWFTGNAGAVSAALADRGLGRGAARACGHVGVELLLDGWLLASDPDLRPAVDGALAGTGDGSLRLGRLVAADRRDDWADHLDRVAGWAAPGDYQEPRAVAERLWRILARRPRLAFTESEIPLVSDVLGDVQPAVEAGADDLLTDLNAAIQPDWRP